MGLPSLHPASTFAEQSQGGSSSPGCWGLCGTFHPLVPSILSSNDISKHACKMMAPLPNLFSTQGKEYRGLMGLSHDYVYLVQHEIGKLIHTLWLIRTKWLCICSDCAYIFCVRFCV